MPHRPIPLITDQVYHVYNRSVGREPVFLSAKDYQRALSIIDFYSFSNPGMRYSFYQRLSHDLRVQFLHELRLNHARIVEILAYCLMPNHFHFVLRQLVDGGIRTFISQLQNSYVKYFNTRHERSGSLFQAMFKGVRIEDEDQLLHVIRYVHLNPYTAYMIKDIFEIRLYPWSSHREYMGMASWGIAQSKEVLEYFKTPASFEQFVLDQADYQRKLRDIRHLILE